VHEAHEKAWAADNVVGKNIVLEVLLGQDSPRTLPPPYVTATRNNGPLPLAISSVWNAAATGIPTSGFKTL